MGNLNEGQEFISISYKFIKGKISHFSSFFRLQFSLLMFLTPSLFVFFHLYTFSSPSSSFLFSVCLFLFSSPPSATVGAVPVWLGSFSVPSDSFFIEVMVNEDFGVYLFYSDKLSIALNAFTSSGQLCIQQEDLEGVLGHYVYIGGMSQAFWLFSDSARTSQWCLRSLGILKCTSYFSGMSQAFGHILGCSLYFGGMPLCSCTFILVGSNGSIMLGPKATSPIRSISRIHASVIGLIFLERYVLGLPKSQAQCCFLKFVIPHPYTIKRNIFFTRKKFINLLHIFFM